MGAPSTFIVFHPGEVAVVVVPLPLQLGHLSCRDHIKFNAEIVSYDYIGKVSDVEIVDIHDGLITMPIRWHCGPRVGLKVPPHLSPVISGVFDILPVPIPRKDLDILPFVSGAVGILRAMCIVVYGDITGSVRKYLHPDINL